MKNWYSTESETAVSHIVSIISVIFGPMAGSDASVQITSTLLILYSQDDNVTSDTLTRDMYMYALPA